jgi:hypothetical protein
MVGDRVSDEPQVDRFFGLARATLTAADMVIGHVGGPHTHGGRSVRGGRTRAGA